MKSNDSRLFRSEAARRRYLARYDVRAAEWPVPSTILMVDTSFGATFVRRSGPEDGRPLALLPGIGSPAHSLAPLAPALSAHFATYAIDNIHDFGRSVQTRAVTGADDFAVWLDEVFTGLALGDDVDVLGLSYGGWIATQYALRYPRRVRRAVLLAPAGTVAPIPWAFIWRGILAFLPFRFPIRSMMRWILTDAGDAASRRRLDDLTEDAYVAQRCFRQRRMVPPLPLTDDDWRRLEVPTLFLAGEREVVFPAHAALARLAAVAPHVHAELLPDVGHDFFVVRADEVSRRVLDFLEA